MAHLQGLTELRVLTLDHTHVTDGGFVHLTGLSRLETLSLAHTALEDRGLDGYRGDLNRRCVTMAEVLRPAGYGTYAVGKWHVTKATQPDGRKDNWPLERGFDRFYGTIFSTSPTSGAVL